jgi:glycosyltransferase involved in cell wall biosynthesis
MKIAVYTISLNEEKHIKRWAESAKDADYRILVDTGSTDNTVQIAKDAGCIVHNISVKPWRFDVARNEALSLLPEDLDWCVSLDADEILIPGWRKHLENLPETITRPRYKYVWSWNPDGSEGLVFYRDHIHRRTNYYWKHPVHEILVCSGQEVQSFCALEVHHHPDNTKSRGQYLPLLELAAKEDPMDDRTAHYLAREYFFNGRIEEATAEFKRHIALPTAMWAAERARSMRYLAQCLPHETEYWLFRALAEDSRRRETWAELAMFYYKNSNWIGCYTAALRGLEIKDRTLDYLSEAWAFGSLLDDIAAVSCYHLKMADEAIKHGLKALESDPGDGRLHNNLIYYKELEK